MKSINYLLYPMILISILSLINTLAYAAPPTPVISYDKNNDTLSVNANNASFKDILAHIASRSGIEIQMDDKAEHLTTITLDNVPLEKALSELARQSNYAFVYSEPNSSDDNSPSGKPMLIGMYILPKGEFSADMLRPVPLLPATGEAFIREKDRYSTPAQKVEIFNHAQQRWEARLKAMPTERREKLLADANEKRLQVEQRQIEREQKKQKHAEKRIEREETRQARLEELKTTDPETYERRMKSREEIRQGQSHNDN